MITKHIIERKNKNFIWFDIQDIDIEDQKILLEEHELTAKNLAYATDKYERARYEHQDDLDLLIYNSPLKKIDVTNSFVLEPITFIVKKDTLFTFRSKALYLNIQEVLKRAIAEDEESSLMSFILTILYAITIRYQKTIDSLNKTRDRYLSELNHKISNQQLLELSNVERSFVYIASGIKTNLLVLNSITDSEVITQKNSKDKKRLHSITVEAHQAEQTVSIALDVTERISSTANNLLNNNLNDVMRFLTIWSLVLTIPTIITGFYGMNVTLPFANGPMAWINISIATIIIIIILVIFFKIRKLF
ncbi:magnesium transporter CorA family protein [Liquorilactobacillus cacaonum]|uniref:Magnesium transporter CorA family protein n=1 Tax=Liquorilactobacillus cacaonum DSM 21116 TaxID=1423729 RepID=A0A0R2CEM7_9LACO|nr:magnesium transporter CorA family protein [Liquorilactobacillus cacaonum]KRM90189.1 hypothetical protein FC80_GL001526 [Liquorilactobacillus cacaonum DSM 21116]